MDVLVRVLGLEVEQLRDDDIGDLVLDGADQENQPLLEQARIDVVGAFAPGRRLEGDLQAIIDAACPGTANSPAVAQMRDLVDAITIGR